MSANGSGADSARANELPNRGIPLLATARTMSDDRIVPNCYHISSSPPEQTAQDVRACVEEVGGPGQLRRVGTDGRKVYSLVYYADRDDADRYLHKITRCIRQKGHEVHHAEVLEDVPDFPGFDEG
jgi:hypothetical protein